MCILGNWMQESRDAILNRCPCKQAGPSSGYVSLHLSDYRIECLPTATLRPYTGNARRHSKAQIKQIADSIRRFGFTNPVLISDDGQIVAGHGRVQATRCMGMETVPTLRLSHLSETERRAYVLADNKLALNAGRDKKILAIELEELTKLDIDVSLTGFSVAEVDLILDAAQDADPAGMLGPEDEIPSQAALPVSQPGDVWLLGRHKLLCGDARDRAAYAALMKGEKAEAVFTDPPYNVPIDGHVTGLGQIRHREFAMGAGEMSSAAFTQFLATTLGEAANVCRDGAIVFVCMDWRHLGELLAAGREVFSELKNLCVRNKTNGGMGTFYRSKHELVCVFKVGEAPHTNTFGLGQTGRYRTNVWDYPRVSSMSSARAEALAMHPTVKPTALVADAIRDVTKRRQLVLDPFAGSGTTLIAGEICGRSTRVIEYDPLYCDTIVRRYEQLVGKPGLLYANNLDFETIAADRWTKKRMLEENVLSPHAPT